MNKAKAGCLILFGLMLAIPLNGQDPMAEGQDKKITYQYFIEGKPVSEEQFIKNRSTGTKCVFENGVLSKKIDLKDGKEDGRSIMYFKNGRTARIAEYENGQKKGFWVEWHENGRIEYLGYDYGGGTGPFGWNGLWVHWDKEGNLIEQAQSQDTASTTVKWYPSGRLSFKSVEARDGSYGSFQSWYENGQLASEDEYKNGDEFRSVSYYENGQKKEERYFVEEPDRYLDIAYYENGQIRSQGQSLGDGKTKDGQWLRWKKDGSLKRKETWKEGKRIEPPLNYYFPTRLFYDDITKETYVFRLEWYSLQLSALEEPILFDAKSDKEVYRFTYLRTFHMPLAVRVERNGNQAMLYVKMADGYGGYDPGILITDTNKTIRQEQWEKLLSLLRECDFWKSEVREKDKVVVENGVEKITIRADGARWLLEGMKQGQYHFVDRWSPDKGNKFRRCCEYLLELSGLRIEEIY